MKLSIQNRVAVLAVPEIEVDRFPFVIGRAKDCDCRLRLAFISRQHCRFMRDGSEVLVQDLNSHAGTFVNGKRATAPLPVRHDDEVSLGPLALRVLMPSKLIDTVEEVRGLTKEEPALSREVR